jgi:hypothetical protein
MMEEYVATHKLSAAGTSVIVKKVGDFYYTRPDHLDMRSPSYVMYKDKLYRVYPKFRVLIENYTLEPYTYPTFEFQNEVPSTDRTS